MGAFSRSGASIKLFRLASLIAYMTVQNRNQTPAGMDVNSASWLTS